MRMTGRVVHRKKGHNLGFIVSVDPLRYKNPSRRSLRSTQSRMCVDGGDCWGGRHIWIESKIK
jgi:hypothetical protein